MLFVINNNNFAAYQAVSGIILTALMIPAILGNFIITITLVNIRKKRPGYFLIACQAVVDCIVGSVCMSTILISVIKGGSPDHVEDEYRYCPFSDNRTDICWLQMSGVWCQCQTYVATMFTNIAYFQLGLISVDRFFAGVKPLRYKSMITRKRMQITIAISWSILALVPIYSKIYGDVYFFKSGFICLPTFNLEESLHKIVYWLQWSFRFLLTIIMGFCYISICFVALHKPMKMLKIGQKAKHNQLVQFKKLGRFGIRQKISEHKHEVKVAATVAIVIITFTFSWLPAFIAELAYFPKVVDLTVSYNIVAHFVFWCLYISPSLNPLIYALHNKKIRQMVVDRIRRGKNPQAKSSIVSGVQPTISSSRELVQSMNPVKPQLVRERTLMDLFPLRRNTKYVAHRNSESSEETSTFSEEVVQETDGLFTDVSLSTSRSASISLNKCHTTSTDVPDGGKRPNKEFKNLEEQEE